MLGFSAHTAYDLLALEPPSHGRDGVVSFLTFECATEPEVATRFATAVSRGGTAVQEPHRTYYGAWQAVVRDPEGNVFRINHLPLAPG
ncbi:Glyoxalase/Bleomycin resistance protein/Dioxygenase superfamily protein [Jatrophihabitans endophyticus]|uniref:Glyoxalase/Bleomycin resistance protein/Dioxygenase superfamily protein n=1 Tax=Jatrophihabitans endophyticus TaxID=1206085 RepID=A0A1M5P7Q0_9ACTN|nr:Glyoxalase/Bleomycin resistance protein/Dioxygenase superfamily protein [Jatrophihabitans endophyticus]